jgi:hypothetical protein
MMGEGGDGCSNNAQAVQPKSACKMTRTSTNLQLLLDLLAELKADLQGLGWVRRINSMLS